MLKKEEKKKKKKKKWNSKTKTWFGGNLRVKNYCGGLKMVLYFWTCNLEVWELKIQQTLKVLNYKS